MSADTGDTALPVDLQVCQSNPVTGACVLGPAPSVQLNIEAGATPTFSIFVSGTGSLIPFEPAHNRIFLRFKEGGLSRGATGVAVQTQTP